VTPKLLIKKYIFVIIPLIIVLLAGIVFLKEILKPERPRVVPPARVGVYVASKRPVKNSYEIIGILEADKSVDLVARVSGFLEEKSFVAGDKVKEGDVLFRIDPKDYEAALEVARGSLLSAEAQLTQAALNFNRVKDLYAKRTSPKSDLDAAQAQLDVAQASVLSAKGALAQAELNLGWASVTAPFDGEVSDSPFSEGSFLGPSSGVLATIVAPDPIKVRVGLADRLLADLRFGAASGSLPRGGIDQVVARVKVNGTHLYEEPGRITYISPLVEKSTDTIQIKATFPNKDGRLVPGEVVTVILEDGSPRDVILVPKNCVLYNAASGSFVYVLGQGEGGGPVAEARGVTKGVEFPEGIEIVDGLKEGDKVINVGLMSGGALIQPGTPVEVLEDPEGEGGAGPASPGGQGAAGDARGKGD
jgi:membrane fusion protein (multidrug efflux system)